MNALKKCDIRLVYDIEHTKNFEMVFLTLCFFTKNSLKNREFISTSFELNLLSQIYSSEN